MKKLGAAFLLSILSLSALADDTTVANVSSVPNSAFSAKSVLDHFNFQFWGEFTGAPVNNMSANSTPNADGSSATTQGLNNAYLAARYKVTPDVFVGPWMAFSLTSVNNKLGTLGDSGLSIKDVNLVSSGPFHMTGELLTLAPAAQSSQAADRLGSMRGIINMNYDIPNSRYQLGWYTYLQGYAYSNGGVANQAGKDSYFLYSCPYTSYQISEKWAASVWVDFIQLHKKAQIAALSNDETDIEPGVVYNINKYMRVNPFINIYPGNPTLSTTYLGMVLAANFM